MALVNGSSASVSHAALSSADGGKSTALAAMELNGEDSVVAHKSNGALSSEVQQSSLSPTNHISAAPHHSSLSTVSGDGDTAVEHRQLSRSPTPPAQMRPEFFDVKESLDQSGSLFLGAGHKRDGGIRTKLMGFDLPSLRRDQESSVNKAKRFAMERSISMVLMRQTIAQQQQQALGLQQHQALVLMCRIYVGSISFELRENAVRQAFTPFGVIKSIDMSWDNIAMKHKGFAFIEYDTPEAAQLAEDQMNNVILGGRNIKVGRPSNMPQAQIIIEQIREEAKSYNRIYIASIHPDLSLQDVRSVFEAFGTIVNCHMPPSPATGRHKGYCYIEYGTNQAAVEAVSSMNLFDLGGQFLRVGRCCSPARALEILNGALPPTTGRSDPMPAAASLAVATASARLQRTAAAAATAGFNTPAPAAVAGTGLASGFLAKSGSLLPTPQLQMLAQQQPPAVVNVTQLGAPVAIPPPGVVIPVLGQPAVSAVTPAAAAAGLGSLLPAPPQANASTLSASAVGSADSLNGAATTAGNSHVSSLKPAEPLQPLVSGPPPSLAAAAPPPVPPPSLAPPPPPSAQSGSAVKSRALLLRNMVGVEDVDELLKEEISEECNRFGSVQRVIIYQEAQGDYEGAEVIVKVFVEFEREDEAESARSALHGRFFGGRQVRAELYSWNLYEANDLSA